MHRKGYSLHTFCVVHDLTYYTYRILKRIFHSSVPKDGL
jgi:hypothetical protein